MYRSMQSSEIKHRRRITSLTYYPRLIHFFIGYFVPEPISSSAPKFIDIEFHSEKRAIRESIRSRLRVRCSFGLERCNFVARCAARCHLQSHLQGPGQFTADPS